MNDREPSVDGDERVLFFPLLLAFPCVLLPKSKAMSKQKLASAAGVSIDTLCRFLLVRQVCRTETSSVSDGDRLHE